jgi:hypothetical protein
MTSRAALDNAPQAETEFAFAYRGHLTYKG